MHMSDGNIMIYLPKASAQRAGGIQFLYPVRYARHPASGFVVVIDLKEQSFRRF